MIRRKANVFYQSFFIGFIVLEIVEELAIYRDIVGYIQKNNLLASSIADGIVKARLRLDYCRATGSVFPARCHGRSGRTGNDCCC